LIQPNVTTGNEPIASPPNSLNTAAPLFSSAVFLLFARSCWARVNQNQRDLFWGTQAVNRSSNSIVGRQIFAFELPLYLGSRRRSRGLCDYKSRSPGW
jgi:hypothetical protein